MFGEYCALFCLRGQGNEFYILIGSQRRPDFPVSAHGHGNARAMCVCGKDQVIWERRKKLKLYTVLASIRPYTCSEKLWPVDLVLENAALACVLGQYFQDLGHTVFHRCPYSELNACFFSMLFLSLLIGLVLINLSIANRVDWLWSPANIKGANKDAKIHVGSSTTLHNLLLYTMHELRNQYVSLASSSVRSKQLLFFVHGQGQNTEQ